MEAEIVSLKKELKSGKTLQGYTNSSKSLDELMRNQQSYSDKIGLGYKEKSEREACPSMTTKEDGYAKRGRSPSEIKIERLAGRTLEDNSSKTISSQGPTYLLWSFLLMWKVWT